MGEGARGRCGRWRCGRGHARAALQCARHSHVPCLYTTLPPCPHAPSCTLPPTHPRPAAPGSARSGRRGPAPSSGSPPGRCTGGRGAGRGRQVNGFVARRQRDCIRARPHQHPRRRLPPPRWTPLLAFFIPPSAAPSHPPDVGLPHLVVVKGLLDGGVVRREGVAGLRVELQQHALAHLAGRGRGRSDGAVCNMLHPHHMQRHCSQLHMVGAAGQSPSCCCPSMLLLLRAADAGGAGLAAYLGHDAGHELVVRPRHPALQHRNNTERRSVSEWRYSGCSAELACPHAGSTPAPCMARACITVHESRSRPAEGLLKHLEHRGLVVGVGVAKGGHQLGRHLRVYRGGRGRRMAQGSAGRHSAADPDLQPAARRPAPPGPSPCR